MVPELFQMGFYEPAQRISLRARGREGGNILLSTVLTNTMRIPGPAKN
jgi:hypothetical protein